MAKDFKIGSQEQVEEINPTGRGFHTVWEVGYTVTNGAARGTTGTVKFAEDDHTAANVERVIGAKVASLNQIAAIGNG